MLAGGASAQPPGQAEPSLVVTLAPATSTGSDEIGHVDVTLAIDAPELAAGSALVQLPLVVTNVVTAAGDIDGVEARDAGGALPLTAGIEGSAETGTRRWTINRATQGRVTVRYRVPTSGRTAAMGPAPPLELRREAGAFSAAGSTFLLLPPIERPYRLSIDWDLGALPRDTVGVSSFGIGDASAVRSQPPAFLSRAFFMAGRIGRRAPAAGSPFFAAWQGQPPFDPAPLMEETAGLHARFVTFFRLADPPPYGVFLRRNPVNPGGGVGLASSFVATFGPDTNPDELGVTLAHEMFHTFAPGLSTPSGLESSWFGEGLAVHYARLLSLRFGAITPDEFLRDLNYHSGRYYTNILGQTPNAEVPRRFWQDTRIRTLPYDRGSLYFAEVDDRVRKASGGRRSLDDLLLILVERQRAGRRLGNADWEELVRAELGEAGVEHFRAVLGGQAPMPASDAFGPCFRRTSRPLRRYDLGFAPEVLTEPRRIVRGLVAGSAAEAAGLRNGDEIMQPVGQDAIQGDQTRLLELQIRRGEQTFPLRYLPRGETVDAVQWERVPGTPDAACAR